MEIDAASNTGVDNVRELIEFSRYGPTSSKYKIFIIDEVHMLSKQAFNALLKTLEEPPEYLKFIFATTEIKKIPITVVSRCQRFDLSRIKSTELFEFIKKIKDKENGKITDDALKLIIKISEGSVRDALSLLDRALLSLDKNIELDLNAVQKIFGYFDKSQLIDLFELILKGEETKVINIYRKIYDQGVEPKVFINDFLELLYYFKNINSLTLESTNFSLNDEEFSKIKNISNKVEADVLVLFWQFAISSLEELDIVSNQHLSIEMFLIRLMHLQSVKIQKKIEPETEKRVSNEIEKNIKSNKIIDQIKNISQEEKNKPQAKTEIKTENKIFIKSFNDLLFLCSDKKEIKLKYELEKNVNLVKFEKNRIEISFNDNLDKDFVKDLSSKLFEWTAERWIITFSKSKGEMSVKEKQINNKKVLIEEIKTSEAYKNIIENFPDAELTNVELNKEERKND
jgi:DNA polymerase-3 subunit gamma/tau